MEFIRQGAKKLLGDGGAEYAAIKTYHGKLAYIGKNARKVGFEGALLSTPLVAFEIAKAPRGYKLADGLAMGTSQLIVQPLLSSIAYIGLATLFPGIGTGMVAVAASAGIAHLPSTFIETRLNRAFRAFRDVDKETQAFNVGYQDSGLNQSYRQNSIREMSGAFTSSRRYLGNEAQFMHR